MYSLLFFFGISNIVLHAIVAIYTNPECINTNICRIFEFIYFTTCQFLSRPTPDAVDRNAVGPDLRSNILMPGQRRIYVCVTRIDILAGTTTISPNDCSPYSALYSSDTALYLLKAFSACWVYFPYLFST